MRSKKPYHKRKPSKKQIELLCAEAWPDDGKDPRLDVKEGIGQAAGRKTLQLCRQVRRALEAVFAADCRDPILQELEVLSVDPAPNCGRLMVTLQLAQSRDVEQVLAHLRQAAGKLRCDVAAAITRRKAPELAFCVRAALRHG